MTIETITSLRAKLHSLILLATALTQQLHVNREALKLVEDTIVNEIWENPAYKNDRARNEQKHLARVNDQRYIKCADLIAACERDRAQCNADLLATQNELEVATTQYRMAMLGLQVAGLSFKLVPVIGANPAEPNAVTIQTKLEDQPATAPVEDQPAGEVPELAAIFQDAKAAGDLIEGEAEGMVFVNRRKAPAPADLSTEEKAPYLKTGSDKKPEKVGNVRI